MHENRPFRAVFVHFSVSEQAGVASEMGQSRGSVFSPGLQPAFLVLSRELVPFRGQALDTFTDG